MSKKNKVKISTGDVIFRSIIMAILVVYTVSIFFIVFWGLMNSFKSYTDFNNNALSFPKLPIRLNLVAEYNESWRLGNYTTILENFTYVKEVSYFTIFSKAPVSIRSEAGIGQMILNTLYIAGVCSIAQVIVCYTTAYLAAKYKFKFSGFIYAMTIMTMSIPLVGSTPATIDLLMKLNLYGNHLGMLVMRAAYSGMYFLVFYAFFEGLPDSFTEAAEIDGASQMGIYLRIILPMGIKMLGTVVLLLFVANWNDYSISFIYMPTVPTLAFGIYNLAHVGSTHSSFPASPIYQLAGCMLLVVPISVIFILFKDKLMGNISAGGLKG